MTKSRADIMREAGHSGATIKLADELLVIIAENQPYFEPPRRNMNTETFFALNALAGNGDVIKWIGKRNRIYYTLPRID